MTENDLQEQNLHSKMVDAEYEYIFYLREKYIPIILVETQDYIWDQKHWYYKYLFPHQETTTQSDLSHEDSSHEDCDLGHRAPRDLNQMPPSLQKLLYRKLSFICHPDKCLESWAKKIFQIINGANSTNNLELLKKINTHWETYKSFETFCESELDKQEIIKKWKSEIWYHWLNSPIIKEVWISQEEYNTRQNINLNTSV